MCGLAGIFTVERPVDATLVGAVLRMLDHQRHRGPDDWGILLPDSATRDVGVRSVLEQRGWDHVRTYPGEAEAPAAVIGVRRLSILDVSEQGRMPMGTPDGKLWVAYNGEIYNFRELRSELKALGYSFSSSGDTEALLWGYYHWGHDVVSRLRGMFAFVVLDARRRGSPTLVLARDRLGIKPLYWTRQQCLLQFTSEVKALLAGGLVANEPEPRGFHGFLVYGSVPEPWTTVRNVEALPPAHVVRVDESTYANPSSRCYWTIPAERSGHNEAGEAVAAVHRLIDASVCEHLVSDVPTGVFLSGGVDSSTLVAVASRHTSTPLTTLCVTFDEPEFSEAEHARRVAERHHTRHVEIRVRSRDFLDEIPGVLDAMDQPTADGVNTYFIARAARQAGLTVALSGLGADELFGGYPGFYRAPRVARVARFPGVGGLAVAAARVAARAGWPRFRKLEFLNERGTAGPYSLIRGMFPPSWAGELLGAEALPLWAYEPREGELTSARYAQLEIGGYLRNQLLRDADVFGMAHSLEIRVPFLDHRLVELVLSIRPDLVYSDRPTKPLLRRVLDQEAPGAMSERPKMGFTFPFERWLHDAQPGIESHTRSDGPVAAKDFERVSRDFAAGRLHWSRFWALGVLRGLAARGTLPRWDVTASPRRVLFILPQVYGAKGGIPVFNQQLLKTCGEAFLGSSLTVISVNDEVLPRDSPLGGRVWFVGLGPRERTFHKLGVVARSLAVTLRVRPDLIVCGHMNLGPLARALAFVAGARTVLVAHGIDAWTASGLRRAAALGMDRVLAVSRFTAERMRGLGIDPSRLRVLANCVDGDRFRILKTTGALDGRHRLLTVARLASSERYKGVDRVIRNLPAVLERYPDTRYYIAGEGDDVTRLRRIAEEAGVGERVVFLGEVSDAALPQVYASADGFVMPSQKEGFGIVFIEALAAGTPVIAGNRDGSTDALLDGELGCLVDPEDDAAIARAMVALLDQSPLDPIRRSATRARVLSAYGASGFASRVRGALGGI